LSRSSAPTPSLPEILVDRSLGIIAVPEALRSVGFAVRTPDDVFGERPVEDFEWIRYADAHGMVVACKDDRIRRRPLEKREFFYSNLRVVCLTDGHLRRAEQSACSVENVEAIVAHLRREGPWVVGIHRSGVGLLRIYPSD
jgi:PIN like domain